MARSVARPLDAEPPSVSVPAATCARLGDEEAEPAETAPFSETLPVLLMIRCDVPEPPWIVPLTVNAWVALLFTSRSVLSAVLWRMFAWIVWSFTTLPLTLTAGAPEGVVSVSFCAPTPPEPMV